jgi:hydrogenase expression/formation protein HypC
MCLAIPGQIVNVNGEDRRTADVRFGNIVREVRLAYVPEAQAGDFVMVHAGSAVSILDKDDVAEVLALFAPVSPCTDAE